MDANELQIVQSLVEPRLVEMGQAAIRLDESSLLSGFGRTTRIGGLHYEINLAGVPCALSIWNIGLFGVDANEAIDVALDDEFAVHKQKGRVLVHAINCFDDVLTLRSEILAAADVDPALAPSLELEMRMTLMRFWPSDLARGLVRDVKTHHTWLGAAS